MAFISSARVFRGGGRAERTHDCHAPRPTLTACCAFLVPINLTATTATSPQLPTNTGPALLSVLGGLAFQPGLPNTVRRRDPTLRIAQFPPCGNSTVMHTAVPPSPLHQSCNTEQGYYMKGTKKLSQAPPDHIVLPTVCLCRW